MRRLMAILMSTFLTLGAIGAGGESAQIADTVYLGGNIYTANPQAFHATAMAIQGQMLLYVGDDAGAKAYIGTDTRVVDLAGQTVIPGIIESHLHLLGIGTSLQMLDAFWKQKDEILSLVAQEAAQRAPGEWITGRGWNQEAWPDEAFPSLADLDAVSPDNPVVLTRTCGHMIWVNSKALEAAGIASDVQNPPGGEYIRTESGDLLGVITDTAMDSVTSLIPEPSDAQKAEALSLAQAQLFSYGITSAVDAGTSAETLDLLRAQYETGALSIRLYELVASGEDAERYYAIGPQKGLYDGRLDIRGVKFMNDGSLGARSAWMLDAYSDREDHCGNGRYTDDEMLAMFAACTEAGFQIATHSIGDAANRQTIDAWEKLLSDIGDDDYRPRIEHFQIVELSDIQRMADLGMIASMQFVHLTSDLNMVEDRIGTERMAGAYAWRKALAAGTIIANGSDAPVEQVNPFHGLYAAVARATTEEGLPHGGFYPEEALTRYEALRAFTLHAAYAQFAEEQKGSLEAGKFADFVVLDRDYMTCATDEIRDIQAVTTVLGGEVVYERAAQQ